MDTLKNKRVLITGAAGFLGANLARALIRQGANVHAFVRSTTNLWRIQEILSKVTLYQVDITHWEKLNHTVAQIHPEIIYHLAVYRASDSLEDRQITLQTNIHGTINLLEAAASLGCHRFIHAGSSLEYGQKRKPMEESDNAEPVAFYGATKAASTLFCQQFARSNSLPAVVLRIVPIYGYWEGRERLIPATILNTFHNRDMTLTLPGYRRDLVFVEDVVDACVLAAKTENITGEIINIGSGKQWTNEEVVEMIQQISGKKINVQSGAYPSRPWDTTHWVADVQKARDMLGWVPQHTLRKGLTKTVSWFKKNRKFYSE